MAVHYILSRADVDAARVAGRTFVSAKGEPLPSLDAIRLALRLDGEVWSR